LPKHLVLRIGEKVKIQVLRNGKPHTLNAVVEDKVTQTIKGEKLSRFLAGAVFEEIEEQTAQGTVYGIEVTSVSGKAAASGVQAGDIILSVNKQRVKNIRDMKKALKKSRDAVLLNVQRNSRGLFLLIQ